MNLASEEASIVFENLLANKIHRHACPCSRSRRCHRDVDVLHLAKVNVESNLGDEYIEVFQCRSVASFHQFHNAATTSHNESVVGAHMISDLWLRPATASFWCLEKLGDFVAIRALAQDTNRMVGPMSRWSAATSS